MPGLLYTLAVELLSFQTQLCLEDVICSAIHVSNLSSFQCTDVKGQHLPTEFLNMVIVAAFTC